MTVLVCFAVANMIGRLSLTLFIAYALLRFGHHMHGVERFGLGLIGGSSLMTLAPIWGSIERVETPFDQWSGVLLTAGMVMFAAGRMFRFVKHEWRNDAQKEQSFIYLKGRGKI